MNKKLPDIEFAEHYCDIPEVFYETNTKEPFRKCTICGIELIESNLPYVIEKAIKNYPEDKKTDVIFEYAICIECVEETRNSLSKESLEKINNYMLNHTDLLTRRNFLLSGNNLNVNDWLSNCVVNNKPTEELPEYQIVCQCQGDKMLYTYMPYMLSCDVTEEIQELLSKQTKDELDRFYDENLGLPPDLKELFKTRTPVF